jgi:5-formyltetrahydrofolate cyclo-ligase
VSTSSRSDLRARCRERRRQLGDQERHAAEQRLQQLLFEFLADRAAGTVALYLPTDGEVDVATIAPALRSMGWTTTLPVIDDRTSMHFARWTGDDDLVDNRYGIAEPVGTAEVTIDDHAVIVVPAVAVDVRGHRLGFGAGFYDRALSGRSDEVITLCPVHDVQVVDDVQPEAHDVGVDAIATTSGIRWISDATAPGGARGSTR